MATQLAWQTPDYIDGQPDSMVVHCIVVAQNKQLAAWNLHTTGHGGVSTSIIRDGWGAKKDGKVDFATLMHKPLKLNVNITKGKVLVTAVVPKCFETDLAAFMNQTREVEVAGEKKQVPVVLGHMVEIHLQGQFVYDEVTGEVWVSNSNKVSVVDCPGIKIALADPTQRKIASQSEIMDFARKQRVAPASTFVSKNGSQEGQAGVPSLADL